MTTPPIQTLTDELLGEIDREFDTAITGELIAVIRTLRAETERLQRFENAFNEWHDKTEWVQAESSSLSAKYLGCHRADVMRDIIESLRAENAAHVSFIAKQVATIRELRKDSARLDWLADLDSPAQVLLPSQFVLENIHSMRDAIDQCRTAMEQAE